MSDKIKQWKIIIKSNHCPWQEEDFKELFCTHIDNKGKDKNGFNICTELNCPLKGD